MFEVAPNIHYGLAMPFSLTTYLRDFGIEGIKALKLHLFVIGQEFPWDGKVFYLNAKGTISFIQCLKRSFNNAWLALLWWGF